MTLPQSTFDSPTPNSAWWRNLTTQDICSSTGAGVIASLQLVLRNALRGPWSSYDGSHATRPIVDGSWGPSTNAALYAYLGKLGYANRGVVQLAGDQKKISPALVRIGIWVAFYQPRLMDLDVQGVRSTTPLPAVSGVADLDAIQLPADAVILKWQTRPPVPSDLIALGAVAPTCLPEQIAELSHASTPAVPSGDFVLASATVPPVPVAQSAGGGSSGLFWAAVVVGGALWWSKKGKRR